MSEASRTGADEAVILVHGTFAGDEADEGPRWWQRGSDTWRSLQALLPSGIALGDVFHWNEGPNSARGRLGAALDLLEKLKELENRGQGYHLVGHSHGGSVIWECLQQAVIQRSRWRVKPALRETLQLRWLRSWTTVGTPFMQFAPGQIPLGRSRIFGWYMRWYGRVEGWMARFLPRLLDSLQSIMAALVLVLLTGLAVLIWVMEPNSAPAYFVSGIFVFFLFMSVFAGAFETQVERTQFHRERNAAQIAAKEFGQRWFGIYSKDDEAIGGLRATLNLKLKVVPKRTLANQVFYSDRVFRWLRPLRQVIFRLYNLLIPPLGDRFISSQLARSAQGNDRPGTVIQHISPGPIPCEDGYLPLPQSVNERLVDFANERAQRLVPELRKMLGNLAASGLQVLQEERQHVDISAGLVHNSYFANEDVLKLITWHIGACSQQDANPERTALDPELADWVQRFKINFRRSVIEGVQRS